MTTPFTYCIKCTKILSEEELWENLDICELCLFGDTQGLSKDKEYNELDFDEE